LVPFSPGQFLLYHKKLINPLTFQSFDQDYVRRLTDGDKVVEQHFATYFGSVLYSKLRMKRLRSPQLVEDIRQETLTRVLSILRKGGVKFPERFGGFVNEVCNRVILELTRADSRHGPMDERRDEPSDPSINLDGPLVDRDTKRDVEKALRRLSAKDSRILRAVYMEDKDKFQICLELKVDPEYLRVLLHRAKLRFRKVYLQRRGPPVPSAHLESDDSVSFR
jgi:RNA polymerase sigma-70 factor (ECF subfamily)